MNLGTDGPGRLLLLVARTRFAVPIACGLCAILAAFVGLGLGLASYRGPADTDDARFQPEAEREAEQLRASIQAEVAALGDSHPWAGWYATSDGRVRSYLWIAPTAGFVLEVDACSVLDRNFGEVRQSEQGLELVCRFPYPTTLFGEVTHLRRLIPVRWGSRRYLISEGQMEGFCMAVNSGEEPRWDIRGYTLLRRGDEDREASGLPEVPDRYRALLEPQAERR